MRILFFILVLSIAMVSTAQTQSIYNQKNQDNLTSMGPSYRDSQSSLYVQMENERLRIENDFLRQENTRREMENLYPDPKDPLVNPYPYPYGTTR